MEKAKQHILMDLYDRMGVFLVVVAVLAYFLYQDDRERTHAIEMENTLEKTVTKLEKIVNELEIKTEDLEDFKRKVNQNKIDIEVMKRRKGL